MLCTTVINEKQAAGFSLRNKCAACLKKQQPENLYSKHEPLITVRLQAGRCEPLTSRLGSQTAGSRNVGASETGAQGGGVSCCLGKKDLVLAEVLVAELICELKLWEWVECLGKRFGAGSRWDAAVGGGMLSTELQE